LMACRRLLPALPFFCCSRDRVRSAH
jgi:hypothetical protein